MRRNQNKQQIDAKMLQDQFIPEVNKSGSSSSSSVNDSKTQVGDEPETGGENEVDSKSTLPLFCSPGSGNWSSRTKTNKFNFVLWIAVKLIVTFLSLYVFTIGLKLLSSGFLLIGKGSFLVSDSQVLQNPVAGIVIGLLITVCLQSSSASTAIAVSLVSSGVIKLSSAIYLIMGANVGTSVTNSIVAFAHLKNREEFERAFAAATMHDVFNALTTLVLTVVEVSTGYLEATTRAMTSNLQNDTMSMGNLNFVGYLTGPVADLVVQINKTTSTCWLNPACARNSTESTLLSKDGRYIFKNSSIGDTGVGVIIAVLTVILLVCCMILIVKILSSLLKKHFPSIITSLGNYQIPYCPWLMGYIAILIGTGLTFLINSSSVFTASLTPLAGMGLLSLELMYPLTLGANLGTTGTAIFAAFSLASTPYFRVSLQVALCHFLFNLTGIVLFYPFWFMRWPIGIAKALGRTAGEYPWFAVVYIVGVFIVFPLLVLGLSYLGLYYALAFTLLVISVLVVSTLITVTQQRQPKWLPKFLRTWDFLPEWITSLEPYDRVLKRLKVLVRNKCCGGTTANSDLQ